MVFSSVVKSIQKILLENYFGKGERKKCEEKKKTSVAILSLTELLILIQVVSLWPCILFSLTSVVYALSLHP